MRNQSRLLTSLAACLLWLGASALAQDTATPKNGCAGGVCPLNPPAAEKTPAAADTSAAPAVPAASATPADAAAQAPACPTSGTCPSKTNCTPDTKCADKATCQNQTACPAATPAQKATPEPVSTPAAEPAKPAATTPAERESAIFDAQPAAPKEFVLPKNFTIAVVRDASGDAYGRVLAAAKKQLFALIGDKVSIRLLEDSSFSAEGKAENVAAVLDAALNAPEVDAVLLLGNMTLAQATNLDRPLTKPVVSTAASLASLLSDDEGLGLRRKDNLARAVPADLLHQDLKTVKRLFPDRNVIAAVDDGLLAIAPTLAQRFTQLGSQLGLTLDVRPVSAVKAITAAEAKKSVLYLTSAESLTGKARTDLLAAMKAKKMPVVSMNGHVDVKAGALAGLAVNPTLAYASRAAANLQQIILGATAAEMDGEIDLDQRLMLNDTTCRAIGYAAPFNVLLQAEVFGAQEAEAATLNLRAAVDLALRQNVDIDISQAETDVSRLARNATMTKFLPSASVNYGLNQIDSDRARHSSALWRESSDGFSITHTVLDPTVIMNYRVAKRNYLSTQHRQEEQRLDVISIAAKNYVSYLMSQALFRIEVDNYKVTLDNLELARVRYKVGRSGPEEVYRWETQEAQGNAELLAKRSSVEAIQTALNQSLGMDQGSRWKPEEVTVEKNAFLKDHLGAVLGNPEKLEKFIRFSVEQAFRNSPTLKSHDMLLSAKRCEMEAKGWKFFLPTINATFDFSHDISGNPDQNKFGQDQDEWGARMLFTLPVFEGGNRVVELQRAKAEYRQLEREKRKEAQQIEKQVRTVIHGLQSSFPKIEYYATASDRAQKNLRVVLDKYKQGTVSILDLLDAQNQAFQWNQQASVSVYELITDLVDYQRSISWFDLEKSDAERKSWRDALTQGLQ